MTTTAVAATPPTAHELVAVDPATLLVDLNVRHDTRLDADFCASISEHGVLVPIVAVRTADGALRVRYGHRRTLAAVQTGRRSVRVVIAADEATDDAATVERLVTQWAENEHRVGLTTAERADVIGQLSAFGVTPTQIARRTRATKTEVAAALAVHGSELARAATARYEFLDLTQAAVVAEFDADPEAVKALVVGAREGRFDHVAQRLRDDRRDAAARAHVAGQLRELGVRVIDKPTGDDPARELHRLADAEGTRLTSAAHHACRGHAAYVGQEHGWRYVDTDGQPVADTADQHDDTAVQDEDPNADEADGGGVARREWCSWAAPRWVCTDPEAHGHVDTWATHGGGTSRTPAADMTDDERDAARAARRDVIDSNKAWGSAETVRREWLHALATRKTAPKGTAGFIATAVTVDADLLTDVGGNHFAATLLDVAPGSYGRSTALTELVAKAGDARALLLTLVLVLAAYEARTDRNDWRQRRPSTGRYLTHLQALGYPLADVERRACGLDPDESQIALLRAAVGAYGTDPPVSPSQIGLFELPRAAHKPRLVGLRIACRTRSEGDCASSVDRELHVVDVVGDGQGCSGGGDDLVGGDAGGGLASTKTLPRVPRATDRDLVRAVTWGVVRTPTELAIEISWVVIAGLGETWPGSSGWVSCDAVRRTTGRRAPGARRSMGCGCHAPPPSADCDGDVRDLKSGATTAAASACGASWDGPDAGVACLADGRTAAGPRRARPRPSTSPTPLPRWSSPSPTRRRPRSRALDPTRAHLF